jgi:hypothetical protein
MRDSELSPKNSISLKAFIFVDLKAVFVDIKNYFKMKTMRKSDDVRH